LEVGLWYLVLGFFSKEPKLKYQISVSKNRGDGKILTTEKLGYIILFRGAFMPHNVIPTWPETFGLMAYVVIMLSPVYLLHRTFRTDGRK
jgi:hypothetical protein